MGPATRVSRLLLKIEQHTYIKNKKRGYADALRDAGHFRACGKTGASVSTVALDVREEQPEALVRPCSLTLGAGSNAHRE